MPATVKGPKGPLIVNQKMEWEESLNIYLLGKNKNSPAEAQKVASKSSRVCVLGTWIEMRSYGNGLFLFQRGLLKVLLII